VLPRIAGEVSEWKSLAKQDCNELGGGAPKNLKSKIYNPRIYNPRNVFAVTSGSVSLINAPAPASLPARYFNLFAVRYGG